MIGFVYILVNDHMPDLCKIGCTERSPHERAAEISKATGVPAPFDVLCYAEVEDFQRIEARLHQWLSEYRVSSNREFFKDATVHAVAWLWWLPQRLSFCAIDDGRPHGETMLCRPEFVGLFDANLEPDFHYLENPFEVKKVVADPLADFDADFPWERGPLKVVAGGKS